MNTRPLSRRTILILAASGTFLVAVAKDLTSEPSSPRQDQIALHQKLAQVHEQAVKCLESGASMQDCDQQLLTSCPGPSALCKPVDHAELQKHRRTHELGGTRAPTRHP